MRRCELGLSADRLLQSRLLPTDNKIRPSVWTVIYLRLESGLLLTVARSLYATTAKQTLLLWFRIKSLVTICVWNKCIIRFNCPLKHLFSHYKNEPHYAQFHWTMNLKSKVVSRLILIKLTKRCLFSAINEIFVGVSRFGIPIAHSLIGCYFITIGI